MRVHILISGALCLALGFYATTLLPKMEAFAMLHGALVLGGALIICGLFSLRMKWHGIIGAAVVSLLGAARGLGNLPDFINLLTGNLATEKPSAGSAAALELGFSAICLSLLVASLRALQKERVRRLLESQKPD